MRIPLSILKKFLDTNATLDEISEKLTSIGLEVEEIHKRSDLDDFIVAKIISFEKHPNADKLNVCKVDNGTEILQIVCGAPNVKADMKVVLAQIGTLIPRDNFAIKKAKIREVESCGMMCSASELLLGTDANGIIELSGDFKVGEKYAMQAGLCDPVIEISLTPNRGDCASVFGVARDLSAAKLGKLIEAKNALHDIKINDKMSNILSKDCAKFGLVKIDNINQKSPLWLTSCLESFGIKPRNFAVDLTNYIMMTYGQPMHAYDADKIKGAICVKNADKDEDFIDLKDEVRKIKKGDIIICDEEKIICIAGIIGSKSSCVDENTKNVILEAAFFDKEQIAKTGQRLMLQTDARFRFERGIDYKMTDFAIDFAINTIKNEQNDAKIIEKSIFGQDFEKIIKIDYEYSLFTKIIGINLHKTTQDEILLSLGYKIEKSDDKICKLAVPSFRGDILCAKNIVEDIARIHGFSHIVQQPISYHITSKKNTKHEKMLKIKRQAASFGYDELTTFTFQNDEIVENIRYSTEKVIKLHNPISSNNSCMRQSLLSGLFERLSAFLRYNINENVAIFEVGSVFLDTKTFENKTNLAFLSRGTFGEKDYSLTQEKSSWLIAKTHLEHIIKHGIEIAKDDIKLTPCEANFAHPYKSFYLSKNGRNIAVFGEFSPIFLAKYDICDTISFAEIFDLDYLFSLEKPNEKNNNECELQYLYRDFSFIVKNDVKIGNLISEIEKNPIINDVILTDIYKNEAWKDEMSISISIKIAQEKQLASAELDKISEKIIEAASTICNAKLRGVK
ncbi:phenylalanine--tRNA ligase subunit beta [Candidatus Deianiraea vastatrix]|uniref:Phenylalanine--tRNA ligase beta subunit n=1 Tax=Candidatus Deianiraea vastatrix TaxID=2163644 RepID=A0A5B8XGH0_9RICK|nr:phenylalanine--tRNA ligase subunit beta [Candidatus Deianiraea vastatrix]QED23394.1 Phenylalanine--tRNA ligase beta subunit [Candidatus Deianiraea vastatrix]